MNQPQDQTVISSWHPKNQTVISSWHPENQPVASFPLGSTAMEDYWSDSDYVEKSDIRRLRKEIQAHFQARDSQFQSFNTTNLTLIKEIVECFSGCISTNSTNSLNNAKQIDVVYKEGVRQDSNMVKRIDSVRNDMMEQVDNIRTDMKKQVDNIRTDMKKQADSTRTDMMKQVDSIREDMTTQINSIREDMTTQINSIREDMTTQIISVAAELDNFKEATSTAVNATPDCAELNSKSQAIDTQEHIHTDTDIDRAAGCLKEVDSLAAQVKALIANKGFSEEEVSKFDHHEEKDCQTEDSTKGLTKKLDSVLLNITQIIGTLKQKVEKLTHSICLQEVKTLKQQLQGIQTALGETEMTPHQNSSDKGQEEACFSPQPLDINFDPEPESNDKSQAQESQLDSMDDPVANETLSEIRQFAQHIIIDPPTPHQCQDLADLPVDADIQLLHTSEVEHNVAQLLIIQRKLKLFNIHPEKWTSYLLSHFSYRLQQEYSRISSPYKSRYCFVVAFLLEQHDFKREFWTERNDLRSNILNLETAETKPLEWFADTVDDLERYELVDLKADFMTAFAYACYHHIERLDRRDTAVLKSLVHRYDIVLYPDIDCSMSLTLAEIKFKIKRVTSRARSLKSYCSPG